MYLYINYISYYTVFIFDRRIYLVW